jgi:YjbR
VTVRKWDVVREFALGLPAAAEDFPWGEPVVKIRKKPGVPRWRKYGEGVYGPMFLWLGRPDAPVHAIAVKLIESHEQAIAVAKAVPTTMSGLGQWGWLNIPLAAVEVDLLCDWVDESYRAHATRKLIAQLDALRGS